MLLLHLVLLWVPVLFCFSSLQLSYAWTVSRRQLMQQTILVTTASTITAETARAVEVQEIDAQGRNIVKVRLESKEDTLGVQVYNTQVGGKNVVAIQRVVQPPQRQQRSQGILQEGMILKDYSSASQLVERIQSGPFPLDLEFINLAGGGDAFSDLGTTIVTPKDALELVQKTEENQQQQRTTTTTGSPEYSITILSKPSSQCSIRSRRNDVLEIEYEASYETMSDPTNHKKGKNTIIYDASSFRGTGTPYQMVLGSGDMIPGVDQGLYDMCPGEVRRLVIPPLLGHGKRSRDTFGIPSDYTSLQWNIQLISIDGTIREENNDQTREEREGRAAY